MQQGFSMKLIWFLAMALIIKFCTLAYGKEQILFCIANSAQKVNLPKIKLIRNKKMKTKMMKFLDSELIRHWTQVLNLFCYNFLESELIG